MSDERITCEFCGGQVVPGTTCPLSLPCPLCNAAPRQRCTRPSGHRADVMHAARWQRAERIDKRQPLIEE